MTSGRLANTIVIGSGRLTSKKVRFFMRIVGLLFLGVAAGALLTLGLRPGGNQAGTAVGESTAFGQSEQSSSVRAAKRSVVALGTIEPRHGTVSVGSPLTGYQIQKIAVQEGQVVKAGDLLIELDPAVAEEEYRIAEAQFNEAQERQKTEVEQAKQRLTVAELGQMQTREGRDLELTAQQRKLDLADLKVKQAKSDVDRIKPLQRTKDPLVSEREMEHQQMLLDMAIAEQGAAKVAYTRLTQSLDFEWQKAASEKEAAQQAVAIAERGTALTALERRIALAQLKVAQTRVTAPSAGTVVGILVHPGEVVAGQPLVQIADLTLLVCHAEVDVADVPLLQKQRKATISSRAFQGKQLSGTIERVKSVVGAAALRPLDPRKPVDRSVTTVILSIDSKDAMKHLGGEANSAAAALLGLQVEVEIPL